MLRRDDRRAKRYFKSVKVQKQKQNARNTEKAKASEKKMLQNNTKNVRDYGSVQTKNTFNVLFSTPHQLFEVLNCAVLPWPILI